MITHFSETMAVSKKRWRVAGVRHVFWQYCRRSACCVLDQNKRHGITQSIWTRYAKGCVVQRRKKPTTIQMLLAQDVHSVVRQCSPFKL